MGPFWEDIVSDLEGTLDGDLLKNLRDAIERYGEDSYNEGYEEGKSECE